MKFTCGTAAPAHLSEVNTLKNSCPCPSLRSKHLETVLFPASTAPASPLAMPTCAMHWMPMWNLWSWDIGSFTAMLQKELAKGKCNLWTQYWIFNSSHYHRPATLPRNMWAVAIPSETKKISPVSLSDCRNRNVRKPWSSHIYVQLKPRLMRSVSRIEHRLGQWHLQREKSKSDM